MQPSTKHPEYSPETSIDTPGESWAREQIASGMPSLSAQGIVGMCALGSESVSGAATEGYVIDLRTTEEPHDSRVAMTRSSTITGPPAELDTELQHVVHAGQIPLDAIKNKTPFLAPRPAMTNQEIADLYLPKDADERAAYIQQLCRQFNTRFHTSNKARTRLHEYDNRIVSLFVKFKESKQLQSDDTQSMASAVLLERLIGDFLHKNDALIIAIASATLPISKAATFSNQDIIAAGRYGVMQGLSRFDLGMPGVSVSAFVAKRIKGEIIDGLRESGVIHASDGAQKIYAQYQNSFSPDTDLETIAKELGITVPRLRYAIQAHHNTRTLSIASGPKDEKSGNEISASILPGRGPSTENQAIGNVMMQQYLQKIEEIIDSFSDRDADIVRRYYQLGEYSDTIQTIESIGQIHNVTESRISQILKKSRETLQKKLLKAGMPLQDVLED